MSKLGWVALPIGLYLVWLAAMALRRRWPSRLALNVHTSLLLMVYLLTTAGLGIFWVANQQLPVFDWHYLFGYATLALVGAHLGFNLPLVVRHFGRRRGRSPAAARPRLRVALLGAGGAVVLGAAFVLGMRHGTRELKVTANDGASSGVETVLAYHTMSTHSRSSLLQRAPSADWGREPSPIKRYPGVPIMALPHPELPRVPLDAALAGPVAERALGARPSAEWLGAVLAHSAGVTLRRGGLSLRAAPSSGALFPSELYLILSDRAAGPSALEPGLYHYAPESHGLRRLGSAPELAQAGLGSATDAPVVVVLSSVMRRTGYKYRDRAYRYAAADAGHLLENLRVAGHALGWRSRLLRRFDDRRLTEALGLDDAEEVAMAAVAWEVGGAPPRAEASDASAVATPFESWSALEQLGATGLVHRATSLALRSTGPEGEREPTDAVRIELGSRAPAQTATFDTLWTRRSTRRFAELPVPLEALAGLLAEALTPPAYGVGITVTAIVNRVQDVRPGVYRVSPTGPALVLLREGDAADAAQSAALDQDAIGDGAVVLVLSVERERALAEGARGYRHAFLEAGMVSERVLLGAHARGLGACPVGAFYDDETAALIGVDLADHWPLHFITLGVGREAH